MRVCVRVCVLSEISPLQLSRCGDERRHSDEVREKSNAFWDSSFYTGQQRVERLPNQSIFHSRCKTYCKSLSYEENPQLFLFLVITHKNEASECKNTH